MPDHDPQQARRLLAEAGYPNGKDFPRVEFLITAGGFTSEIAQVLQSFWQRELGMRIDVIQQEAKVVYDALDSKK